MSSFLDYLNSQSQEDIQNQAKAARSGFAPLPAGWYSVRIADAEVKPFAKTAGEYLMLTLEVTDGEHANRKLFDRLMPTHENDEAARISRERLSALREAIKLWQSKSIKDFVGKVCKVKVRIGKPQEGYDPKNEISGYDAIDGAPKPSAPTTPTQGAAASANTGKPPSAKGGKPPSPKATASKSTEGSAMTSTTPDKAPTTKTTSQTSGPSAGDDAPTKAAAMSKSEFDKPAIKNTAPDADSSGQDAAESEGTPDETSWF